MGMLCEPCSADLARWREGTGANPDEPGARDLVPMDETIRRMLVES